MKTKLTSIASLTLTLFILSSCASRPKLYPNETLKSKGKVASEKEIDACMKDADEYVESGEGKKIAKSAGFGAMVGGAIGAVGGAFTGNIARGAAQGAAMGGAGGAVGGALTPDQLKHRYVNKCLADKGYEVLGWD
jgi:outer membrane lipoprotein SlyB